MREEQMIAMNGEVEVGRHVSRRTGDYCGEIEMTLATGRGGNHNDCAFLVASGEGELLDACSAVSDIAQIGDAAAEYLIGRSGQLGSTTLM